VLVFLTTDSLQKRALSQLDLLHASDSRLPEGSEYLKDTTGKGLVSLTGSVKANSKLISSF
jgi:hypothetical protein